MNPLFEHRFELGGFATRALELDGEGPPIVLLHGYSDSADTWRFLLDRLLRRGRRAIAVDMPGFGEADRLDRSEPILPQLERFATGVARHVLDGDDEGAVVVGNSLGGTVALLLAERDAVPIWAIVPIAPAGLDMARWFPIIEGAPLVRGVLRAPVPLPSRTVRAMVGRAYASIAFAHPRDVPNGVVASFTQHVSTRRDVVRILATGRTLLDELRDPFELSEIDCPVTLVWGDRDRMVFATGAERVLRTVPGSRLEMIENCGHCPQIEAPDRLLAVVATAAEERVYRRPEDFLRTSPPDRQISVPERRSGESP